MLLARLLRSFIRVGRLDVIDAGGRIHQFGNPQASPITIQLRDPVLHWQLALNPRLRLGEAYMDGLLTFESDHEIGDLLALYGQNLKEFNKRPLVRILDRWRWLSHRFLRANNMRRSRRQVAHHYDLDLSLYDLFLDSDRQYSCAFFDSPESSLEDAQLAKKRHIASKLVLKPGQKILDIGSGWGGLGLYLASTADVQVTGVTLSKEQLTVSEDRAREMGLHGQVTFDRRDYRHVRGRFDRIVSVGMFEHVGPHFYQQFFDQVHELLADDGVALLHSIGRKDGPGTTNPWIDRYIFPGGYIPSLSEVIPAIERAGLWITDIEILRLHYAETLKAWRARYRSQWQKARILHDARFCRMWDFYLAGSEMAFRYEGMMVFQIQLAKKVDSLPLTRTYMQDRDDHQASIEQKRLGRANIRAV